MQNNEIWSNDRIKELTMKKITEKIINSANSAPRIEVPVRKKRISRKVGAVAVMAAVLVVSAVGVNAMVNYLSPSEVALELDYPELAEQFEVQTSFTVGSDIADTSGGIYENPNNSSDSSTLSATGGVFTAASSTEIASVTSGDYIFTLIGVTSGKDLTVMTDEAEEGSTYAVVAIENADGTPFDKETYYDDPGKMENFFVSPLIHGRTPWMGGAIAMAGGGYTERIIDGKLYRLVNCDNVEIFADTGVSLAVSTGMFFTTEAFEYDDKTGLTTAKKDFDGSSVIFELPLDPALGDPDAAAAYWNQFESDATRTVELPPEAVRFESLWEKADWEDVTAFPGTAQTLTPDEDGKVTYSYSNTNVNGMGSGTMTFSVESFLHETGEPVMMGGGEYIKEDGTYSVFSQRAIFNEDGTVTIDLVSPNNI
jgi:hypothetical protein